MISLKGNFLFIHRSKSGGNSITTALLPFASDNQKIIINEFQDGTQRFNVLNNEYMELRKHSTIREYKLSIPDNTFNDLYKFSILRNPFDRLVSAYFHPIRVMKKGNEFIEAKFKKIIQKQKTLREFVCLNENDKLDDHLDRIIRFEKLQEDFKIVMRDLGFTFSGLRHLNRSNRSNRDSYRKYYSTETRQLLEDRFCEELEFGGYTF